MRSLEFALNGVLDERARRLLAAAECKVWGPEGVRRIPIVNQIPLAGENS